MKLFLKLYLLSFSCTCMWLSKHMSSACFLRLELHLQKKLKNVLVINRIDQLVCYIPWHYLEVALFCLADCYEGNFR